MGKITAIVGRNASGKTQYVERMRRQIASDSVRYIAFRDSYGASVDGAYYLQLRWNQHDIDHETPTVGELLDHAYQLQGSDSEERRGLRQKLYSLFHIEPLLDKYIISLSSGELRKFQLTRTLFSQPRLLIMDNPFVGLDSDTRAQLRELLQALVAENNLDIILVVSKTDDLPPFLDSVTEMVDGEPLQPCSVSEFASRQEPVAPHVLSEERRQRLLQLPRHTDDYNSSEVVSMRNVSIRYGSRNILRDINWTVKSGEHWAISGQNGAGKSTLLSLVCADNPQSYACDIALFGQQRGSGETIWDIKRHIGYVSPEMHRSYQHNMPAENVVASGLKDTVGLYVRANSEEREQCRWWMDIFGIAHLAERPYLQLSSGEQRLVLLARAFVKDPQLLILDEPLHGLDPWNRRMVKDIIETFCQRAGKTMMMVTHYADELPDNITNSLYLTRQ